MKYSIVTTFHQPGLDLYAQNMIDSFDQYWPSNINLYVYAEDCDPKISSDRIHLLDLHQRCPDLVAFKQKHKNNPVANGMVMKNTGLPYTDNHFKWDAVRFSNKVFAVIDAITTIETDWIIWLDADSKTFRPIPDGFLDNICDPEAMACYLGRREKYHSECGWVAYNRRHPSLQSFANEWKNLYTTDRLFDLDEYHDSYVFDVLRKKYQHQGIVFKSISPITSGKGPGHPFIASELGKYIDHLKGSRRKEIGKSMWKGDDESASFHPDVDYWAS